MAYWIVDTFLGTCLFGLVYAVIGVPVTLALLPRADWRSLPLVTACAIAFGGILLTAWMFILSTVGVRFEPLVIVLPLLLVALMCGVVAWRKRKTSETVEARRPLTFDEKLLIALVALALIVRWIVTAYWTFTAYDALWVYGYEARLYALTGGIPNTIAYYPQFLPLHFTFAQLPAFGGINDHVARGVIPLLHLGAILAAYMLGLKLISRRAGIMLAAVWALYPHVGEWSRAGDLEIPLTFAFTLAAAFFLTAWTQTENRNRCAVLAGLTLGLGMWIKPTMGAFILGVVVLVVVEFVRVRFDVRAWLPRLRVAVITGIFCLPLGAAWYIRNLLLGHSVIDFPPSFWQTLAVRSGVELGWWLAVLVVVTVYLFAQRPRPNARQTVFGWALILAGTLPTILPYWLPVLNEYGLFQRRMTVIEFALFGIGVIVLMSALWRQLWSQTAVRVGWALLLGLPYFVVWFWSYSYHYRLSFAVVPLLILPIAAVLAQINIPRRFAYTAWMIVLALPGLLAAVYDPFTGWDYLWNGAYPDDDSRYRSGNAALMTVVDGLRVWKDEHPDETLVVAAPGVDRLPFFFPLDDIRVDDPPTQLEQLNDTAYFVYGAPETIGEYQDIPITQNQVIGALGRNDITRLAWGMDDGIFRYDVYELSLANRWQRPQPNGIETRDVIFGGFARYLGYDIGGLELWQGRRVIGHLYWEALQPADGDYSVFIHLRDADGRLVTSWDNPVARTADGAYYATLVWDAGEFISDERVYQLPPDVTELGEGYQLVIGFYDPATNRRLPVAVDGVPSGDEYVIENRIQLVTPPDE